MNAAFPLLAVLTGLTLTSVSAEPAAGPAADASWAQTPVMGWNSWDDFATTITEAQARVQADKMKELLAGHGWKLVTVDIQWYEPSATGFDYRPNAVLAMDEWGRLLPAVNRFPSAAGGQGFKPLADYIHSLGLRFGLHLMRGIPRQAVVAKTPIKGTNYTAADIADTHSTCPWNGDMYGVDMSKPGAQEYFDSVFALFASWGLDFVKVDDLSAPYHQPEVEGIRRAINHSGRPIVFSTSPGPTPLAAGPSISAQANMWRISGDFWDNWYQLSAQFDRLRDWTPFRGPGHFPDADMLPLGTISLGKRQTNFTPVEQRTLLSLWSIARSPLILGADLTKLDPATLALITNDEVIAVDQDSANNRELFARDGFRAWVADVPGTADKYLALFNLRPQPGEVDAGRAAFQSLPVTRGTSGRGAPIDLDVTGVAKLFLVVDDARGGDGRYDTVWSGLTAVVAGQPQGLSELKWTNVAGGHQVQFSADHGATLTVAAQPSSAATHIPAVVEIDLPSGATRFQAVAGIDENRATPARGQRPGPAVRFMVFTQSPFATAAAATVPVKLSELGIQGSVRVRDLWRKESMGSRSDSFEPSIDAHGAGLYRLTPAP